MPINPNRSPWAPQVDADDVDKTARIVVLEVQYSNLANKIDNQSERINELGSKIDNLGHKITDRQFVELRENHEKELKAVQDSAETSSKVKLLWAAGGVLITACIAIVVAIMKYRFGG